MSKQVSASQVGAFGTSTEPHISFFRRYRSEAEINHDWTPMEITIGAAAGIDPLSGMSASLLAMDQFGKGICAKIKAQIWADRLRVIEFLGKESETWIKSMPTQTKSVQVNTRLDRIEIVYPDERWVKRNSISVFRRKRVVCVGPRGSVSGWFEGLIDRPVPAALFHGGPAELVHNFSGTWTEFISERRWGAE